MGHNEIEELLKKQTTKMGIDLFGVASPKPWNDEVGFRPKDLFPLTESVLVIGMRYLYGSVVAPYIRTRLMGLNTGPSAANGVAFNLARWLQNKGYYALPSLMGRATMLEQLQYDPSYGALYRPLIDNRIGAIQAGLGSLGKNGLVITKTLGPRVGWATILTNAYFEPGEPFTQDLCGDCNECVKECPEVLEDGWEFESCWRATQIKGIKFGPQGNRVCTMPCMTSCPRALDAVQPSVTIQQSRGANE
jgi:epoxyqueuosine reductase QueG